VGSTPTRATDAGQECPGYSCVGWALASLSGCNPPAFTLCRFNSCPTHWTARSSIGLRIPASHAGEMGSIPIRASEAGVRNQVSGASKSARERLTPDSRPLTPDQRPSGGTGRHTTLRTSRLERHGSSTPPLVTAEWTGVWFQHGLISRSTPVQIRPPQLKGRRRRMRDE
jgi:hypothetical protein